MAEAGRSLLNPPIEALLEHTGSKFVLITLAAKRARQINDYRTHLGEGLGTMIPPQVEADVSKPLSLAFEEIAAGLIVPEMVAEDVSELVEDEAE